MALSAKLKRRIEVALARRAEALELIAAVEAGANAQAEAVADIADPSTASAEDVANKVNELMASMRAAGQLAE
jgi:hypothetical protein